MILCFFFIIMFFINIKGATCLSNLAAIKHNCIEADNIDLVDPHT